MGKRHRQRRSIDKKTLVRLGCKENELGELKKTLSKADARRRLLERLYVRHFVWPGILDGMCKRAAEDVAAEEDARVLAYLESEIARLSAASP